MNTSKLFIIGVALIGLFVSVNTLQCYECVDCEDATVLTDADLVTCGDTTTTEVVTEEPTTPAATVTEEQTTTTEAVTEEQTTTTEAVTEEQTTTTEAVTEEQTTTTEAVTEEQTTTTEAVTEEQTTTTEAVTEEQTTTTEAVTEEQTTTTEAVTEEQTTTTEAVTEEQTTTTEAVTEEQTTTPEAVTEEQTTTTEAVVPPLVVVPVAARVRRNIFQKIDNLDNGCRCNGKYCVCDDDNKKTRMKRASSYTDNEITYVCTKVVTTLDGTDVTVRGCAPSHIGDTEICASLEATSCHTCDTDKCNSGNIAQQSIAILLVILVVGLFTK